MPTKYLEFFNLDCWQKSRELTLLVYRATTKFPKEEVFGITSQMKRSSVSVGSNLAEGYIRFGILDKRKFYNYAESSLVELLSQLITSKDLGYLDKKEFRDIQKHLFETRKFIKGLIRSTKTANLRP